MALQTREERQAQLDNMGMFESATTIVSSIAKVAVTVTCAVETASQALDYYAEAAKVIGESNLLTVKLSTAGKEAQKIERLQSQHPTLDWDALLKAHQS